MTITLTREEAQQVLDVLNDVRYRIEFGQMNLSDDTDAAIDTLRTKLTQPEREWQGLTDEEIDKALWENESNYLPDIIRIAEAKLKEKNR
jgi:hypothetical protein